jgi:Mg2+ and Co2+ transporter CorA
MNMRRSSSRSFATVAEAEALEQAETKTPQTVEVENQNVARKQLRDAVKSNDMQQAYDLLCTMIMINNEQNDATVPDFTDFAFVLKAMRDAKGRKTAEMATHLFDQLKTHIDEKRLSNYHDLTLLFNNVLTVWLTCTTPPQRVKLKNVRDIFNISQEVSSMLQDVESRHDFTPTRATYNLVLNIHVRTAIAASSAQKRGEDYDATLHIATLAAEAAEEIMVKIIQSPEEQLQPDLAAYKSLLTAWANVRSLDATDRILSILESIEEHFEQVDATIYSIAFNALAQAAPLMEFDPADPTVPANKAVALLRRLVSQLKKGGPYPLDAMCYASVVNAFAKSVAPRDFGELAPANLASACLRQCSELYEIGFLQEGPNDFCYGNTIAAWTRHANINVGSLKADVLLYRLEARQEAKTDRENRRQRLTIWYNMVLHSFSRSSLEDAPERAEAILSRMENSSICDDHSYEAVIANWAKNCHSTEDRAKRAEFCLARMKSPPIMCYNMALAACAANGVDFADNGLLIAEKLFGEIERPNAASYSRMMSVYNSLLSNDVKEKDFRLERLFEQCCEHGQVTKFSLHVLKEGMSNAGLERVFGDHIHMGLGEIYFNQLPTSWTKRSNRSKDSGK